MVFVEELSRKGKKYYYISKNFGIGRNKWKRIRKYVGKERPSKEDVKFIAEEIEKEALKNQQQLIIT